MSFNFVVGQINTSMERLVVWYQEFMRRTEQSFKALHNRITRLEEHQAWVGPSDEQVERVLRKILAERFADAGLQHAENAMKDDEHFVKTPKAIAMVPQPIPIEFNSIKVDPNAMPSQEYAEEMLSMMETSLPSFPNVDVSRSAQNEGDREFHDAKASPTEFKRPTLPPMKLPPGQPWS